VVQELGLTGKVFVGPVGLDASLVEKANVQLLNPAGSGILIVCVAVLVSLSTGADIQVKQNGTALATLVGNGKSTYLGKSDSVGEVRSESLASPAGTLIGTAFRAPTSVLDLGMPWYIPPGEGLVIAHSVNDAVLSVVFKWYEEGGYVSV
jgi:hypothetical protein